MKQIVIILCDVRSCYNVGSIFRTADAAGVNTVICCGITPYPRVKRDTRPEKIISSNSKEIHKTALGAEESVTYLHFDTPMEAINHYQELGLELVALENKVPNTEDLFSYTPSNNKIALVVGSETSGLDDVVLKNCSATLEIPMHGIKNSLNVSVATGIAIYSLYTSY